MPLKTSPKTDSPSQKWEQVGRALALALEGPQSEECENLVGSLGPLYEEDPEAVNILFKRVDPKFGLERLMEINPTFDLDLPPREIVQSVVETLMSLKTSKTSPLLPKHKTSP